MKFLTRWFITAIVLLAVVKIVPGIYILDWPTLFIAALVIGLLNAFLRPFLLLLTLPVNILTLGLFTLIVNAAIFSLTSWLVRGFYINNFWGAFLAALVFSILSFLINTLTGNDDIDL